MIDKLDRKRLDYWYNRLMPDSASSNGQRFQLLYQISQAFNSSLDIFVIFDRVIDEVIQAIGAERGFLVVRQPTGKLKIQVARSNKAEKIDLENSQLSQSIINQAIEQSEPVLSFDAASDTRFQEQNSVVDLKLKSILCVPLKCRGTMQGVIYLENRAQESLFDQRELDLLTAIAANASIAIDNAQNFLELQEQLQTVNMLYEISADLTALRFRTAIDHDPGTRQTGFASPGCILVDGRGR